jgi:cytochrome c peroxidase
MSRRLTSRCTLFLVLGCFGVQAQGLPPPVYPPGNDRSVAKLHLGKALFWDEQMSSTNTVACGTCHIPSAGFSDPRVNQLPDSVHPGFDGILGNGDDVIGSFGVPSNLGNGTYVNEPFFGVRRQVTPRRTQPSLMSQYGIMLFWDGRADTVLRDPVTQQVLLAQGASLENQALGPFLNEVEMGHVGRTWADVIARVQTAVPLALASNIPNDLSNWISGRSYRDLFQLAFGTADVTPARIAMAIATYERELRPNQSPFDLGTMNAAATRGSVLFNSPITRCTPCHVAPFFTDNLFANTGVRPIAEDRGRAIVTGLPADEGAFRIPSLRNVALRAPFFHNGRFNTLREVIDFYDRGGDFAAPNLAITPMNLNAQQKNDLHEFMLALTDPRVAQELPPFDRPRLSSEDARMSSVFGVASPASSGVAPRAIAEEPARIALGTFTIGVDRAHGGIPVFLLLGLTPDPVGIQFQNLRIHLNPLGMVAGFMAGFTTGQGVSDGAFTMQLGVPNSPSLIGFAMHGQWLVADPVTNGWSMTEGFTVTMY